MALNRQRRSPDSRTAPRLGSRNNRLGCSASSGRQCRSRRRSRRWLCARSGRCPENCSRQDRSVPGSRRGGRVGSAARLNKPCPAWDRRSGSPSRQRRWRGRRLVRTHDSEWRRRGGVASSRRVAPWRRHTPAACPRQTGAALQAPPLSTPPTAAGQKQTPYIPSPSERCPGSCTNPSNSARHGPLALEPRPADPCGVNHDHDALQRVRSSTRAGVTTFCFDKTKERLLGA